MLNIIGELTMCLGVPGQIMTTWIDEQTQLPMAQVDFGGIGKNVCLAFEETAQVGDYVMVHVGFAISLIDAREAEQTLKLLQQIGELDELAIVN
jgi:hydrogenase expression/formation protein HypC